MKRLIFRNPFVSKTDKDLADLYLSIAVNSSALAECSDNSGNRCDCVITALNCLSKAARLLGFKNVADMHEYKRRHGHF